MAIEIVDLPIKHGWIFAEGMFTRGYVKTLDLI
jgi:hypothetical protein